MPYVYVHGVKHKISHTPNKKSKKEKKSRLDKLMRFHPEMAERVSYMDVYYLSISLNEIIEESWNKMQERVGNGIFCKKNWKPAMMTKNYFDLVCNSRAIRLKVSARCN